VTFLDAYALVALVTDEPAAEEVQGVLRSGGTHMVVVNLAEAIDVSIRVYGASDTAFRAAIEPLLLSNVLSLSVSDEQHAWLAGGLRARHLDRKTRALSLADCFLLAHSLTAGAAIVTADPAVLDAAQKESIELIPLPDPSGRRP
jgi:predicted nucleic acid-binding protein